MENVQEILLTIWAWLQYPLALLIIWLFFWSIEKVILIFKNISGRFIGRDHISQSRFSIKSLKHVKN